MAKATAQQMDAARGTVEVTVPATEPEKPAEKVSKKGPLTQSLLRCGVVRDAQGNTVLVCGLSATQANEAISKGALWGCAKALRGRFCSSNAVLTKDGVSRVFAGEAVAAKDVAVTNTIIVNEAAYVAVPGDNLLAFPSKVVFLGTETQAVSDEEAVKRLGDFCDGEETAKFSVELLKVGVQHPGEA